MRSHQWRLAGDRRRTFLSGGGIGPSRKFQPRFEQLEDRRMLACDVDFRDGELLVAGDDSDNAVEITVGLRQVQVTCDGVDEGTFRDVRAIQVLLHGGKDSMMFDAEESLGPEAIEDTDGEGVPEIVDGFGGVGEDTFIVSASATRLLRLDGGEDSDAVNIQFGRLFGSVELADSGVEGENKLRATGTRFADKIEVADGNSDAWIIKWEGPRLNAAGGTDIAIESLEIAHEGFELGEVQGGDGDDELRIAGVIPAALHLFGQGGNDLGSWSKAAGLPVELYVVVYDGGEGDDRFAVNTAGEAELIEIAGTFGRVNPDPLVRVSDLATGAVKFLATIAGTEEIDVEASAEDEFSADNSSGALGKPFLRFRFGTVFTTKIDWSGPGDEGPEESITFVYGKMRVVYFEDGPQADRFAILSGTEPGSLGLAVTSVATGKETFHAETTGAELVTIKGGDGDDEFLLTTTDAAESVEISGERGSELLDTRIRVTDLASGEVATDLSIVGTEAIGVDTLAGGDMVAVSDAGGPLGGIEWSIDTGAGDDVLLIAIQSRAGLHQFDLDAGVGRDQLRFQLPASHAGVDLHAALVHGGLVDLVLEHSPSSAVQPIPAAKFSIAIDGYEIASFSELQGITTQVSTVEYVESSDKETIVANLGSRADLFTLDFSGESRVPIDLSVDAGAGNDRIDVRSRSGPSPIDLLVEIEPGDIPRLQTAQQDEILVAFEFGDIGRPFIIGALWNTSSPPRSSDRTPGRLALHAAADDERVLYDLDIVGRSGADVVRVDATSSHDAPSPSDSINYVIDISGSMRGGNDWFTYTGLESPPVRIGTWILDATMNVDMGPGNDQVVAMLETPAEEASQKVRINTGDGADGVTVVLRRLANPHLPPAGEPPMGLDELSIATGAGSDTIDVTLESAAAALAQKVSIVSGAGNDRVSVNAPESQLDGFDDLIVGADAGAESHVRVFDGRVLGETSPYGGFTGEFRVATGDVNGDGVADVITGAGAGAPGGHVKVFDGATGSEIRSFFAYGTSFAGGVFVASADVNGDGRADIITAVRRRSGGHVKVFDGRTGAELASFLAYPGFLGGITVAGGDVNGDGRADIITGAGPGATPHVKVFDGRSGAETRSFLAYGATFSGGVFVAAGDLDNDGLADIITGADAGALGGHVKVFSGATGAELRSFFAFDTSFAGGVRVAAGDVNGDGTSDIIVGAGPGAPGGHVKVFDATGGELGSFFAFDPSFTGGIFVAGGDVNSSVPPRRLDLDLAIDTAGGADRVDLKLGATATEEVLQKVQIATGDGADRASVIWSKLQLEAEFPSVATDLDLNMGAGNDVAEVELQGDDTLISDVLSFEVRLGTGNDVARYWVFGTELPATPREPTDDAAGQLALRVLGGLGNDDIAGRVGSDPAGQLLPLAFGELLLEISGGAGRDRLSLDSTSVDDLVINAVISGGGDNDRVRASFDLGASSTGQLSVQVLGDAGNDDLGLSIVGEEDLDAFFALLDGGIGRDKCRATKNVTVRNCELK